MRSHEVKQAHLGSRSQSYIYPYAPLIHRSPTTKPASGGMHYLNAPLRRPTQCQVYKRAKLRGGFTEKPGGPSETHLAKPPLTACVIC